MLKHARSEELGYDPMSNANHGVKTLINVKDIIQEIPDLEMKRSSKATIERDSGATPFNRLSDAPTPAIDKFKHKLEK